LKIQQQNSTIQGMTITVTKCNSRQDSYHDDIMLAVKARGAEIVVQEVGVEVFQAIEMVLSPLPHIAEHIVKPSLRGRVQVHRLKKKRKEKKRMNK
jgi:hypothetical protein